MIVREFLHPAHELHLVIPAEFAALLRAELEKAEDEFGEDYFEAIPVLLAELSR